MTDAHKEIFKNTDQRRYDPILLEKIARVHMARIKKLAQVAKILRELRDDMWGLRVRGAEDVIYDRSVDALSSASYSITRDADFENRGDSSRDYTQYHQNLAAGVLGYRISQMSDEEFDAKFPKEEKDNG